MSNLLHLTVVGKGQPLVLLHGWGWHSGIWSSLIPHLADKFELFIPDLPGFGNSLDYTTHYSFEEILSQLIIRVPSQAVWLGWSLGGMIAWWAALHYPEKVGRLITVASSPKFTSDGDWPGVSIDVLNQFSTQLVHQYEQTIADFLSLQLRGSPHSQKIVTELKSQLLPAKNTALMGGLRLLQKTDLRSDLSRIKIPSLHIFGSNDVLVPVRVMTQLQPLLSNGQCAVIKRAAHLPFLSHQNEFLRLVQADDHSINEEITDDFYDQYKN